MRTAHTLWLRYRLWRLNRAIAACEQATGGTLIYLATHEEDA